VDRAARTGIKRAVGGLLRRRGPRREDLPLSTWGLARDASGALVLDGVELRGLLDRMGSPLYVVDAARLASNAARFTARPGGASRSCEVYYSYKTNPIPGVLRVLHERGVGAEVVSPYELWLALRMGVDPRSIVYNGPAKAPDSLVLALDRGVGLINCDHRSEIAQLALAARSRGKTPRVGVRVVPPGASMGQFGERIDTGAALRAYREALAQPELRVVALHAHYNGEISELHVLDTFLSSLLAFCDELKSRLGLELEILDIGGNLACPTITPLSPVARRLATTFACEPGSRPPGSVLSIEAYVARVLERIEGHYAAAGRPTPRVFIEPGRALTGDSQMLLCRVLSLRDPDPAGLTWGVLDAGINAAEGVRNEIHALLPLVPRAGEHRTYRLTGPSCTLGDLLFPACSLPPLEPGDGLAIMDTGAYFVPFATCFSFPRPGIVMIDGGRERVLRRFETFDDMVSLEASERHDE
jgi:diaminopimelate decarboxylase